MISSSRTRLAFVIGAPSSTGRDFASRHPKCYQTAHLVDY